MKTLLLSIAALAIAAAPAFGEDKDDHKKPRTQNNTPAPQQKATNNVPRSYTPRVQQALTAKTQALQNKPNVNRTYTPQTYTPTVQNRTRTFTPADQDAPRSTVNQNQTMTNNQWQRNRRNRTDTDVVTNQTPNTTTTTNANPRNRDWNNTNRNWSNNNNNNSNNNSNQRWSNNNNNRNWSNNNTNRNWNNHNRNWNNNNNSSTFTFEQARRHHRRDRHDRSWWSSRYSRIALFAGGYYFWDSGYWYPAYGYDPYYSTYTYDEPIYGYNDLAPGEVITNVQAALQEQGYYQDEVDGLIGPNTRAALSNFQRDHGLPVTAAIDGPTLQALGLY